MSRGPGRWQRAILNHIEAGDHVCITHASHSASEQNALRRAADTLEAAGKIKITTMRIDGRPRLVAVPLDADVDEPRLVTGLDGKTYRTVIRGTQ